MTRNTHTRRQLAKATVAAIATAALLVPVALANSVARNTTYDPWFQNAIATQRSQPDPWFQNAIAIQRSQPDPWFNNAIATQRSQPDPWFNNAIATQRSQPDPWFNNALAKQRSLATLTNHAGQTGYRFITDTLGGNGQPATSGYQLITDTLAPGGGSSGNSVPPASHGFDWADAGAGAAGTLALLILTGRVVALRKRGRLAF
jgi:hypothetical protein